MRPPGAGNRDLQGMIPGAFSAADQQQSAGGSRGSTTTVRRPRPAQQRPTPGSAFWLREQHAPARNRTPINEYVQEFTDRWEGDLEFQTWFMSRAIAAGLVSGDKASVADYMDAWENLGKAAAVERGTWKGTPEQLLEFLASGKNLSGGQIEEAMRNGEPLLDENGEPIVPGYNAKKVNPITTIRSTSSATINREAAYAAADQLSQALLGRMASPKEMRKARAVMNRLLRDNPTVNVQTRDETDPNNVKITSKTTDGMSAQDAQDVVRMRMQRSSEGTAYTVGNMFEGALSMMAQKEG